MHFRLFSTFWSIVKNLNARIYSVFVLRPHFCMSVSAQARLSHIGLLDESFPKKIFVKKYSSILKYHSSFIHSIFGQNFYHHVIQQFTYSLILKFAPIVHTQNFCQYVTVYLVWIWTYEDAYEKAHTFSWRSKNGYCVNSPLRCVCTGREAKAGNIREWSAKLFYLQA